MKNGTLTRRQALVQLLSLCGSVLLSRQVIASQETQLIRAIHADPNMRQVLVGLGNACVLLDANTSAAEVAWLERAYLDGSIQHISIARWINDLIRQDFAAGKVVSVDGWILSRSEVALFLYSRRAL